MIQMSIDRNKLIDGMFYPQRKRNRSERQVGIMVGKVEAIGLAVLLVGLED